MKDTSLPLLAVDLDGTLLRSDMLHETFWSAVGSNWRQIPGILRALRAGRAQLKAHLAGRADVDVTTLPYNDAVVDHVKAHRAAGGRTALVTATDQRLADKIADHLGIFDDVHGSDGTRNLKAAEKAALLQERYGAHGYAYMGDSGADLAVWPGAKHAITVNAAPKIRAAVDDMGVPATHLEDAPSAAKDYLKALRPHQWMKNLLIFLPMFTAQAFTGANLALSFFAFVAFCLVASSVYVLNDLLDLRADRAHPRKCRRPFAAGRIPIAHGMAMAGGLLAMGALISAVVGPVFFMVMVIYYLVTFAYSMNLKRRTIIDICVLAGLYAIRIVAGAAATGIALSVWLLAFAIFLFFSLAAVKRLAELVDKKQSGETNVTGRGYVVDDITIVQSMAVGSGYVSVLVMALYVNAPVTQQFYSLPEALWGICCVLLYWVTRTIFQAHRGFMHDDPVIYAVKDPISRFCILLVMGFGLLGALW